jgi:hypothetical protein
MHRFDDDPPTRLGTAALALQLLPTAVGWVVDEVEDPSDGERSRTGFGAARPV